MGRLAYYAHCIAIYETKQEARDIEAIKALGFDVENPGDPKVDETLANLGLVTSDEKMAWFEHFADTCDLIIFRSLPDGRIPSGVGREIAWFKARNKPVLELPSGVLSRQIDREETREYIREVGKR